MSSPGVGELERAILAEIDARAPVTAREVAERFGDQRGLSRSTVLTVIGRLRRKGFLDRKRREGVFEYSPRISQPEVLRRLVGRFVETTLGGAVSPVVAYMASAGKLSDTDLDELQRIVDSLRAEKESAK